MLSLHEIQDNQLHLHIILEGGCINGTHFQSELTGHFIASKIDLNTQEIWVLDFEEQIRQTQKETDLSLSLDALAWRKPSDREITIINQELRKIL